MSYRVETWPVARVMQTLKYSVDCGDLDNPRAWARLLRSKASDVGMPLLIDLISEVGIIDPIEILMHGWAHHSDSPRVPTLGNGHHRLVAAILLGMDTIPVALTDDLFDYQSDSIANEISRECYPDTPEDKDFGDFIRNAMVDLCNSF